MTEGAAPLFVSGMFRVDEFPLVSGTRTVLPIGSFEEFAFKKAGRSWTGETAVPKLL